MDLLQTWGLLHIGGVENVTRAEPTLQSALGASNQEQRYLVIKNMQNRAWRGSQAGPKA